MNYATTWYNGSTLLFAKQYILIVKQNKALKQQDSSLYTRFWKMHDVNFYRVISVKWYKWKRRSLIFFSLRNLIIIYFPFIFVTALSCLLYLLLIYKYIVIYDIVMCDNFMQLSQKFKLMIFMIRRKIFDN